MLKYLFTEINGDPFITKNSFGKLRNPRIKAITEDYTIQDHDDNLFTTGTIAITLPAVSDNDGKEVKISKADAGTTITINPSGSDTISGQASQTLTNQGDCMALSNDGISNWFFI